MSRPFHRHAARVLATATLAMAASTVAQAGVIDLEDVTPTLASAGLIATSGGFDFTSDGTGFSGVDSAVSFASLGNAPDNSSGQFLFGLNNDAITMGLRGLSLLGLDAAFIAPVPFAEGTVAGQLQIAALTDTGLIELAFDFGAAGTRGNWSFFSIATDALASANITSITFSACVYDGLGGCARDAGLSQFALDNLRVPAPTSAALALAALGLLAATRRRQSV